MGKDSFPRYLIVMEYVSRYPSACYIDAVDQHPKRTRSHDVLFFLMLKIIFHEGIK